MATSEGIPSSIDIEFLELNDNPYYNLRSKINSSYIQSIFRFMPNSSKYMFGLFLISKRLLLFLPS